MTPFAWRPDEFVLLRELNHRHLNGLQSIANAIARLRREPSLALTRVRLADLEERIFAHSSLHELLSEAPSPEQLEIHCLALCFNLVRIYGCEDITPYVHLEAAELSAAQTFWLSLLVVELVTNVLKHSLAEERGGTIWVDMRLLQEREVELTVCDSRRSHLGDRAIREPRIANALVQLLAGTLDVLRDDGFVVRVRFPLETQRSFDTKPFV
jgi:two-component sensor histidine kinase